MKNKHLTKFISLVLALMISLSSFAVLGINAFAVGTKADVYLISLPRSEETNKTGWGHSAMDLLNGWKTVETNIITAKSMGGYEGNACYCIEEGVPIFTGDTLTQEPETFWDNYPSEYNDTISPYQIKAYIGRIMQYGFTGKTSVNWMTTNAKGADDCSNYFATQILIWETVIGERDENFNKIDATKRGKHNIKEFIGPNHPLRAKIFEHYNRIEASVKKHTTVPSFASRSKNSSSTYELKWNGSSYSTTITDTNNVLSEYDLSASGLEFSKSGNKLTISTNKAITSDTVITMNRKNSNRKGIITWTDGVKSPDENQIQDLVTYGESVSDPVAAYFKVKVSEGNAKVIKESEDGKISGIKFTLTGNGVNKTTPTDSKGVALFENLPAGTYTITEEVLEEYEPQKSKTVTVVGGQTASVSFSNILKRGTLTVEKSSEDGFNEGVEFHLYGTSFSGENVNEYAVTDKNGIATFKDILMGTGYTVEEVKTAIKYIVPDSQTAKIDWNKVTSLYFTNKLKRGSLTVTKTCEDGFLEGHKFHLYGISLSGAKVDEYAVTNKSGVASFKDILIGTGYTIEEVETAVRYVVPDKQTASIEWNKITNINFSNKLKKFRVKVVKEDIEKGIPQGDASLSGAIYGLYKGDKLIAKYTTDENASFTTDYYPCGTDWTIREITASEGYLVNEKVYKVGVDPKQYTLELNTTNITVQEQVIKGKISIIKHTDDGSTQIETPEKGAEFQVYLKSAGSYANAKEYEKDTIICDEDGFASTKLLPYGIYTVHQTKGWDGREKIKDFDVYISKDGQIYKFLINNSNFCSYLKVVKLDKETNKPIAYAGAAFEIYDNNGHRISMQYTYPNVTTVHTFYTNNEGYLITPERLPYGEYTLVEASAPYGYVLDDTPIPFSIKQENTSTDTGVTVVKVTAKDLAQKGYIEIKKTGEIFSSVNESNGIYTPVYEIGGLKNAVFQIYAAEDIVTLDGTLRASKGELVDEITTDKDGIAKSKQLYLGKYTVVEKTAPNGYVNSNEKYEIELTYAGQSVSVTSTALTVSNERQKVSVSLSKIIEQSDKFGIGMNEEILSVQFGVFADEDIKATDGTLIPKDSLITLANCDKDGKITFNCDLPIGFKYYVKEVSADNRYIISDAKYPFTAEYGEQNEATVLVAVNNGEEIYNEIKSGTVTGVKVGETDDGLANALIGLFAPDTIEFTEETAIATVKTADDGSFVFEDVPYGDWIIKEITAPTGYVLSTENYVVFISDNEEVVEIKIENKKIRGNLEIVKTDVVSGEALAGVGFRIYDKDKNIIAEGVTDENGKCTFENLEYGEYFYQEFSCSDSYVLDDTLFPFSITEDGMTVKAKMTNRMKQGKLIIHKVDKDNKENVLAGVEFTVTDKDGNVIAKGTTDKTGTVSFDLPYGEYIYFESKTLNGYILDSTKYEIRITDDGQIIEITAENEKQKTDIPKTGDESHIYAYIAVAIVSAVLLAFTSVSLINNKKKEQDEDDN